MNGADTTRGTVDEDVGPRAFGTFCRWPDWRNDVVGGGGDSVSLAVFVDRHVM